MSTLTVVLASASGLVFGYATAAHFGSRARHLLETSLKSEKDKALKDTKDQLKTLKSELGDLKKASDKAEKLSAKSEKKAKELEAAKAKEAESHAEEIARVQAELEEAKAASEASDGLSPELSAALESAGSALEPILQALIDHEGQKAALLADLNGIKIASAGDSDTLDGISAASNVLVGIPARLDNVLPLKESFSFRLQDGESAIVGHAFESAGEVIAVTTVGTKPPSDKAMESAMESLSAALE